VKAPSRSAASKKKVVKPTAAKKTVKKAAPAKKVAPAKKAPAKLVKPIAKKVAVKKPAAKTKVVAKKATPAKTVAVKAPAKKVASQAVKSAAKKPVTKTVVKKAAPTPAKKATPAKASTSKVTAKKAVAKKEMPTKKVVAAKPAVAPKKTAQAPKSAAPAPEVKPVLSETSSLLMHKKNSKAAKMAALVPPPPAPVVASNAAKSSFTPISVPTVSSIVPVIPTKDAKLANNWKTKSVAELTDAEVIAMPDEEYMNDVQMAFFRLRLHHLKQEVLSNASETTEHLREDTVVTPDPADRATIEEEHALELRTRDRERKLLKKIEQSINRIDAGDYGYCDETGEPIGVARLLARPTATLSLEAQERRELKQKMFGD
jgi:DnaK suppressor protein